MVRRRPRGFRSVRTALIGLLVAFMALALGLMGVFVNSFTTHAVHGQTREREALFADSVQLAINRVLFAGKYQAQAYAEAIVEGQPDLNYVMIIDSHTRQAIAHSDPRQVGRRFSDPATEKAFATLTTGRAVEQTILGPHGERIHDWALPYERGYLHERDGIIRIGLSATQEEGLLRQYRIATLGLIGLTLLIGAALAVAIGFRLTSNLERLLDAVRRFGEGDYNASVPAPAHPRDELDELALTFNQMAGRLRGASERLEQQVEERTAQLDSANRELRESRAQLQAFFDNTPALIYIKDLESRRLFANRQYENFFPELSIGELIGKCDGELFSPEDAAMLREHDRAVIERGGPLEFEEPLVFPSGLRTLLSVKFPLRDANGRIYAVGGVSTDISERKRLEERLRQQYDQLSQLDRLKTEFVNAVSHDLRTPLTSIVGYAEFLEDEIGGPLTPDQREFARQIEEGAKRLEHLVNDLLDFARLEAGTFQLRPERADLATKVREVVSGLKPQADQAGLTLRLALPDAPLMLEMDAQRIDQVLTNLVHNAIKFTPPGGEVVVRACAEDGEVRCEVQDTGPGIAKADVPRLFQRFSQLQPGMAKGGTGLGLWISRSIIEAHRGRIGVESTPGQGSTFWFSLPASFDT